MICIGEILIIKIIRTKKRMKQTILTGGKTFTEGKRYKFKDKKIRILKSIIKINMAIDRFDFNDGLSIFCGDWKKYGMEELK